MRDKSRWMADGKPIAKPLKLAYRTANRAAVGRQRAARSDTGRCMLVASPKAMAFVSAEGPLVGVR